MKKPNSLSKHELCYAGRNHEIEINGKIRHVWAVPIAVIYVPTQQGSIIRYLCRRHLDKWLDIADDCPAWEPSALIWI